MAGIKELRLRIKSIGSIKQITKAMEMVASTKLRRFQDRAVASRPYAQEITGLVGRLSGMLGTELGDMPFFRPGQGQKTLVLAISSDRGLCGPYNTNLFRKLESWLAERKAAGETSVVEYYVYGRKGASYLTKRGRVVTKFLTDPPMEKVDYRNAALTSRMLQQAFMSGEYKDVTVFYTAYESASRFVPTSVKFLPLTPEALGAGAQVAGAAGAGGAATSGGDLLLEPDGPTIFSQLVPRYLEVRIYNALLEALTSEYASRRFAMKNATDAASDMQKALKSVYNRKRQESITKDLLDIVGGAEAVK